MAIELVGLAALLAAAGIVGYFIKLERENRRHVVIQILLVALLLEILMQPDGNGAEIGLFRIPIGPFDARPADLIVPLGLAARALSSHVPRRLSAAALLWICFIVWYGAGAPVGFLNGNPLSDVIAQGRGVIIGGGLMILVAGIDVREFVANDRIQRAGRFVGVIGTLLLVTHFSGIAFTLDVPVVGFRNLGALDSDARTLFPILGVMAITAEVSGARRRLSVIIPSFALISTPIAATQGGPYLSLLVLLAGLTFVALGTTWKRRMNLTALDVGFVLSMFLVIGAGSILTSGGSSPAFVDQFEEAVLSDTQATTTGERFQLWDQAGEIVAESPVWGVGLGVFGTIERTFPNGEVDTTFHNVPLDIAARTGLVGAFLAAAALGLTLRHGATVWRKSESMIIASVAMTSCLGLLAVSGRALVASSLEHTRITVGFFLLVGLVMACWNTYERTEAPVEELVGMTPRH